MEVYVMAICPSTSQLTAIEADGTKTTSSISVHRDCRMTLMCRAEKSEYCSNNLIEEICSELMTEIFRTAVTQLAAM